MLAVSRLTYGKRKLIA